MATILAPYNTAMQLGAGFNSYTQQMCVNDAVGRNSRAVVTTTPEDQNRPIAQEVTYKTQVVDKVTDVTNAMNINAAFSIKYDAFDAKGKGDFLNTSKIKESTISFLISVKVVNQVLFDHSLTEFRPIEGLKNNDNFTEVYGDSFIAGFQEGGEFVAIISVKARNEEQEKKIKADAAIAFTGEKVQANLEGTFSKENEAFLAENETTISVTWTGGGQDLKKPEEDWTFETMKAAALKFPNLVARTPIRTHAILVKYSALRSFHAAVNRKNAIPNFELAGVYTGILQEAFLDYKTILKNLQVLAFDASSGKQTLEPAPAALEKANENAESSDSDNGVVRVERPARGDDDAPMMSTPLRVTKPYPPTLWGLEHARQAVRYMLNRIVAEVDLITRNPSIAVDENRRLPYMSPFLFKEYLPVGVPIAAPGSEDGIQKADEGPTANPLDVVGGNTKIF